MNFFSELLIIVFLQLKIKRKYKRMDGELLDEKCKWVLFRVTRSLVSYRIRIALSLKLRYINSLTKIHDSSPNDIPDYFFPTVCILLKP